MAARGIRGQSIANERNGAVLFGGFDDHFVSVDPFTGRITRVESAGRTVLYPWDDNSFLCLQDALGRPAKAELTLRSHEDPSVVISAGGDWGAGTHLIPGHYPTVFAVEGGRVTAGELTATDEAAATVSFVPGVFTETVPATIDGAWTAGNGAVVAGIGVGRDTTAFFATPGGIVVVARQDIARSVAIERTWRPAAIDHDPIRGRLLVASWNRWRSLGGPSSDVYVFDENGGLVAQGKARVLVDRMALTAGVVTVMDVEDNVAVVDLAVVAE